MEDFKARTRVQRIVLTTSVSVMALVVVPLLVLDGPAFLLSPVGLGLLLMVAAGAVMTVDLWRPRPRPEPRTVDGATRLTFSRVLSTTFVLGAVGFAVLVAGGVALEGWQALDPRESGVAALGSLLAPVALVAALVQVVLRDRVDLTPEGLVVRRVGRTRRVAWDDVGRVELVTGLGDGLKVHRRAGRPLVVPTAYLGLDLFALRAVVERHRDEPDQRRYLGTDAELERLAALRSAG